jgi:hypothetical protein
MSMFLQTLFLLAFWPAVYITHEQSAAMIAAEQKIREREQREQERQAATERIAGQWVSAHGDGAILQFVENRFLVFRFSDAGRQSQIVPIGSVKTDGQSYLLATSDSGYFPARINGAELEVEFGTIGQMYFERRGLPWEGIWRFKRLN